MDNPESSGTPYSPAYSSEYTQNTGHSPSHFRSQPSKPQIPRKPLYSEACMGSQGAPCAALRDGSKQLLRQSMGRPANPRDR